MPFALTALLASALIFWIEPLAGKELLPLVGGAPGVWNVCLLFFQTALFAGYAFAHALTKIRSAKRQGAIYLATAAAAFLLLPVELGSTANPADATHPTAWLLQHLATNLFLPFVTLAAAAPLLQHWYSRTRRTEARDPYFLYAASNVGSLLALLLFPFALEPNVSVHTQARIWTGLFVVAAIACALASTKTESYATSAEAAPRKSPRIPTRTLLHWIILAAVPSSLLMGVTTFITADIAPVPLLWIVPLALYLLTFIVAFSWLRNGTQPRFNTIIFLAAIVWCIVHRMQATDPLWLFVLIHLTVFTVLALAAHAKLSAKRPAPESLTTFYLAIAAGGAIGGAFNALVAPAIFNSYIEYPLALIAAVILTLTGRKWRMRAGALLAFILIMPRFDLTLNGFVLRTERNFYGVIRVTTDSRRQFHELRNGSTLHGAADATQAGGSDPLMYYWVGSPVSQVIRGMQETRDSLDVAVIGLGVGTLAWYARPTEHWTFYEINPAVIDIARDTSLFTYLATSRAGSVNIVQGDARFSLSGAKDGSLDIIILDAFTSDAIPIHLLTREAVQIYASKLRPGGVIALHITNRYLRLAPPVARVGTSLGFRAWDRRVEPVGEGRKRRHEGTEWLVLSRETPGWLARGGTEGWSETPVTGGRPWTDDYSNIWTSFRR